MSDSLPEKWYRIDQPEDGLYTLITIAGLETPDGVRQQPLYVCKSDDGNLNEAFHFGDNRWSPWYGETVGGREFWQYYDDQSGQWIVGEEPPEVTRFDSEVIHVKEVRKCP
jgi:hypothetical protein